MRCVYLLSPSPVSPPPRQVCPETHPHPPTVEQSRDVGLEDGWKVGIRTRPSAATPSPIHQVEVRS
ncbi:hypothetical protein E2C01_071530 [Portunus trituberculatus]|uniref:Uncharacterized protein n=1 Tax=Portunus trituberculatus TaxID=210409 RepID=A0A5B7I4P3_PORTR|nr:hypothetical protein [Portunus trituberculatus]